MTDGGIILTPNYANLFEQFAREAQLKADTIMADFPDALEGLDDDVANVIRRDVLQAFHHILNSLNICTQCTTRVEYILKLRDVIGNVTAAISLKADEYATKVEAESSDGVCDTCGRAGVEIARTDANGKTVCEECDAELAAEEDDQDEDEDEQ